MANDTDSSPRQLEHPFTPQVSPTISGGRLIARLGLTRHMPLKCIANKSGQERVQARRDEHLLRYGAKTNPLCELATGTADDGAASQSTVQPAEDLRL